MGTIIACAVIGGVIGYFVTVKENKLDSVVIYCVAGAIVGIIAADIVGFLIILVIVVLVMFFNSFM